MFVHRSMGASIEDAAMQHLQENLPMDGQLRVAAGDVQPMPQCKQTLSASTSKLLYPCTHHTNWLAFKPSHHQHI